MSVDIRFQATPSVSSPLLPELDYTLVGAAVILLGLGLVMVASASLHRIADAPFYFVIAFGVWASFYPTVAAHHDVHLFQLLTHLLRYDDSTGNRAAFV